MKYLLDTNICSAHMRRPGGLAHRFLQFQSNIAVPTIAIAELYAGARQSPNPAAFLRKIAELLDEFELLNFDIECAEAYGWIKSTTQRQGITIPSLDLTIAAVALAHDLTLVTHNTADFERIPNLRIEDWLSS